MEEPTDFFFWRETMSKLLFNNIAFSPPLSTRRRQHKTKLFFHRFETTSSSLSSSLFLLAAVSAKEILVVFPDDSKVIDNHSYPPHSQFYINDITHSQFLFFLDSL